VLALVLTLREENMNPMQHPNYLWSFTSILFFFYSFPIISFAGNLEIESLVTHPSCSGLADGFIEVIPLNGEAPYTYSWSQSGVSIGQNEEILMDLVPGPYQVDIVDATGTCGGTFTFLLDEPQAFEIELVSAPAQVQLGDQAELQILSVQEFPLGTNFFWSVNEGLSCFDCPNPVFTPTENAVVSVTVVQPNGCSNTVSTEIRVQKSRDVYIPNIFTPNADGINDHFRPYPGNGVQEVRTMRIYNRFGELLYEETNPELGWNGRFRGDALPAGVYTYWIEVLFVDRLVEIFAGDVILIN
ncbi:MAG: gliding motility-associated C-terminal domain-containing protein, partial [Bacteroidota bacterium]